MWFSIPSYVTTEKGVRGILKDSCDDFIVQEIDKDGHIVELKNTECPAGIFMNTYCYIVDLEEEQKCMTVEEGIKKKSSILMIYRMGNFTTNI